MKKAFCSSFLTLLLWQLAIQTPCAFAQSAPVVQNQNVVIARDSALTLALPFTNGGPAPYCKVAGEPSFGTVTIAAGCIARYIPNVGYTGKDKFGFRVFNDKIKSVDVGTIFITISAQLTLSPTATRTATATATKTNPPVATQTQIPSATATITATRTSLPTSTSTQIPATPTQTKTLTIIPSTTPTPTSTNTATVTRTATPVIAISSTPTSTRTATPTKTLSPAPTATATQTSAFPAGDFVGDAQSLAPYKSRISEIETKHLFKHVAFGGSASLLNYAADNTLDKLIDALITGLVDGDAIDKEAALLAPTRKIAESRVIVVNGQNVTFNSQTKDLWTLLSAQAVWIHNLRFNNPLREMLAVVLHNHMAVSLNHSLILKRLSRNNYLPAHMALLRNSSLGNIEKFLNLLMGDGGMLLFLDNRQNSWDAPNENFGRELLELGAVGKRDALTFDTSYNEDDMRASTRAVSGFHESSDPKVLDFYDSNGNRYSETNYIYFPAFRPTKWMPNPSAPEAINIFRDTNYEGSSPFKSDIFSSGGSTFIPYLLYNHPNAARFIGSRIFSRLVHPNPSPALIRQLGEELLRMNYELKPFIKKLLTSSAMFSQEARNSCIMSPVEVFMHFFRALDLPVRKDNNLNFKKDIYFVLQKAMTASGQTLLDPPSIFGWNECGKNGDSKINRGENWLGTQLLLERQRGIVELLNTLEKMRFDWTLLLPRTTAGVIITDPNVIISSISKKLGMSLSTEETLTLAEYLTTLPDANGEAAETVVWDPNSATFTELARIKVPGLLQILFDDMRNQER